MQVCNHCFLCYDYSSSCTFLVHTLLIFFFPAFGLICLLELLLGHLHHQQTLRHSLVFLDLEVYIGCICSVMTVCLLFFLAHICLTVNFLINTSRQWHLRCSKQSPFYTSGFDNVSRFNSANTSHIQ